MTQSIKACAVLTQEPTNCGVEEKSGVFGNMSVKLGQGLPINHARLKTPVLPYPGFSKVSKPEKHKSNILRLLLSRGKKLKAKQLLGAIKAKQDGLKHLNDPLASAKAQQADNMWFSSADLEQLSNDDLVSLGQTFTSAEMEVVQTALTRDELDTQNDSDVSKTAARLLELRAMVLKEINHRVAVGLLDELKFVAQKDEAK